MRTYWTLVRRELGAYFLSWTGYVIICGVIFLLGVSSVSLLESLNQEPNESPLMQLFFDTIGFWLVLLLAPPVITMRSFALERYSGTFETLMTAPVGDLQVVLAKFTGAFLFYVVMWVPLLGCLFVIQHFSNDPHLFDVGMLASSCLGIVLWGALYLAMGCFASAQTRSQIIAAVVSFALGISLFLLSFLSLTFSAIPGWRARILRQASLVEHMRDFAGGVVDTRPVVFYSSLTILFLFLTLRVVESRRWKE